MSCATEDNLAYYNLEGLQSATDYDVLSSLSAHKFTLNVCQGVKSQLWNVLHLPEDRVGAFYRGAHGDFAMGSTNSTLSVVDGNPVLYLNDGSPCPNAGETKMLANTAIRFICDNSMFGAGDPQLIAQFPADDEHACSFYFEWRTHYACPSGRKPAGILHLLILFASFILIALLVYVLCVTLYNRFFLGLRGWDQFPSIPCFSPLRFFTYLHDKITGRGDGFVGGPPSSSLPFGGSSNGMGANGSNGRSSRWGLGGSGGASKWRWTKWARQQSNGYGRVPEEEEGILENDRGSFDDGDEESTPRGLNGPSSFDNAWAGARSGGSMDNDGVIRLMLPRIFSLLFFAAQWLACSYSQTCILLRLSDPSRDLGTLSQFSKVPRAGDEYLMYREDIFPETSMTDPGEDEDKGIRILSFGEQFRLRLRACKTSSTQRSPHLDNGGTGSYSQLFIMKEYMGRIASDLNVDECDVYPADYFELMGGVGFGGLIALMLGHLRMNVEEASEALVSIALAIFPPGAPKERDPETNMKYLREAIEDIMQARQITLETRMYEKNKLVKGCKVALYATTSANLSHPTVFRTYSTRGSSQNPTIVDAICATMAAPPLLPPVKIGPRLREQSFVGGPLGANNPTRELLKEAAAVFGKEKRVSQIVSIGSGRRRAISLYHPVASEGINRLVEEIASDCETVTRELSARLFNVTVYLRLNVDQGMEDVSMNDWDDLGAIETHASAYVETPAISEALDASLQRLREKMGTITLEQINHSSNIKSTAKSAPVVSPYYVVRQKELRHMVHHLVESTSSGQKVFSITGMGGCGKTQMASYFLRENRSLFTHTVFVDASSQVSIKADLQAWARSLGNGHEQDVWEDGLRTLTSTSQNGRWIFILDNADDPGLDLVPYLPKCHHGTVVITSRNRDVGNLANTYHLELGTMEPEEALSTLMQAARRQQPLPSIEIEDARQLMKELGYLALALVHAGSYCHQLSSTVDGVPQPYSFTKYLALFHAQRAALMKKAGPTTLDGYRGGVYTTLDLSYQAIPPMSKDFLHVVSNFYHSDISFSMLETAVKNHFKDPYPLLPRPDVHGITTSHLSEVLSTDGIWDEIYVQETIQNLRSFSLISTTVVSDSLFLQLHPLVQAWARDKTLANSRDYCSMAGQLLTSCCSKDSNPLNRHLVSHIGEMLQITAGYTMHINDKVAVAQVLKEQGRYCDAEVLFTEALATLQEISQEESKESLLIIGWLADAAWYQGHWSAAERLYLKVLEARAKVLGAEHPETIHATFDLASTYSVQGRWSEAEKLERDVLEQRRRIFGPEHPDTIRAAANLACTYRAQGRLEEAETLRLEVLEQDRRILGPEHPDTIRAAANLACTYRDQGRLEEAETLRLEVLEQDRRILGPEHPDTIRAAANLACTYRDQGRLEEAETLEREVLEQRTRIFGPEHPDTIRAAANLACTYRDQGRLEEAETLRLEVLEQYRRILGPEHPDTIRAAANLATTYHDQGRLEEAETLEREVLEQRTRILGPEHPNTLRVAVNLGSTYYCQGKWLEAETLISQAVESGIRVLGAQNPHVKGYIGHLVYVYEQRGKTHEADEAEKLLST